MAENGSWGHGFSDLRVAMVPMMLLTNRPQSDVATLFKSLSPPTTYHLAQTVALALGVRLETPDIAANRFFLNSTMPFALAGFMEVRTDAARRLRVKHFARNGQLLSEEVSKLPEIAAANAVYASGASTMPNRRRCYWRRQSGVSGMSDRLAGAPAGQAPRGRTCPTRRQAGPYRPFATRPRLERGMVVARPSGGQRVGSVIADLSARSGRGTTKWIIPEGYGVLEFSQFVIMLVALARRRRGCCSIRSCRRRPFVLTVTIIGALSCLYIAGEEMSWGQHFFHWNTPEYWAEVNRQEETNLHNTYAVFEKWPRAILEVGVVDRRPAAAARRDVRSAAARQPAVAVPAGGRAGAAGDRRHVRSSSSTCSSRRRISASCCSGRARRSRSISISSSWLI